MRMNTSRAISAHLDRVVKDKRTVARFMNKTCQTTALLMALLTIQGHSQQTDSPINRKSLDHGGAGTSHDTSITLDVVVTDKAGRPIAGLTSADFTVLDDRQAQEIRGFAELDRGAVKAPPREGTEASEPRLIVVLDDAHTRLTDMARARAALADVLRENNGQLDELTMLAALTTDGLVVLNDFTRDGNAINNALARHQVGFNSPVHPYDPFAALLRLVDLSSTTGGHKTLLLISSILPGKAPSSTSSILRSQPAIAARAKRASDLMLRSRTTLDVIDPRSAGERSVQDSDVLVPDFAAQNVAPTYAPSPAEAGRPYQFHLYSTLDVADALANATKLEREGGSAAAGGGFAPLALETGGSVVLNTSPIKMAIKDVATASATYYTVVYQPPSPNGQGKFHTIEVRVDRPNSIIHSRNGYYVKP
jgi:VWFA-related protein